MHAGWYRNWRQHHRGFGWFGPLFWPYAYDSIFGNVFWPYAYDYDPFWDYGYGDIYTAMFYPYSYEELVDLPVPLRRGPVNAPALAGSPAAQTMQRLAPLCGDDSREVAGVPVDEIQTAVAPNDAQRAVLDELGNAAIKAAQIVKDACPNDIALTPTGRLAAMQRRIEAMIEAVAAVRSPLEKFYDMLSDEQKARFDAIGQRSGTAAATTPQSLMGKCSVAEATQWPTAQIERVVRPTPQQFDALNALKRAADGAAELLKSSCPTELPVTPSARFAAISARLYAMLDAIKTVSGPLNDFYASLSNEQKAQFNNIGRLRTSRQG
ncbi:MAG: Spy/CpxP family protein refolding chaperone [Xanthobacteraceae bacterium]